MPLHLQPHILDVPGTDPAGRGKPSQFNPKKGFSALARRLPVEVGRRRALQSLELTGRGGQCFSERGRAGAGAPSGLGAALGGLRASHPRAPRRSLPPCPTVCGEMLVQCPLSAGSFLPGSLDHPSGPGPRVSPRWGWPPEAPGEGVHDFTCVLAASRLCGLSLRGLFTAVPLCGPQGVLQGEGPDALPSSLQPVGPKEAGKEQRKVGCSGHVGWCWAPGSL